MQGLSYFKTLATSAASSLRQMAVTSINSIQQKEYFKDEAVNNNFTD